MHPSPIVPVTTTSGEPSDGTHSTLRPHGRAQALRHEGRLRRDHGDGRQTPARTSAYRRRSAQRRDQPRFGLWPVSGPTKLDQHLEGAVAARKLDSIDRETAEVA